MKTAILSVSSVIALASLMGCSVVHPDEDAAAAGSSELEVTNIAATTCEIFIDKVAAQQVNYHGAFGAILDAQVFLKIDKAQLDRRGGIKRIAFFGTKLTVDNDGRVRSTTGSQEMNLTAFYSDSYYKFGMGDLVNHWWDRSNSDDAAVFEGAFFVEANDGTRLWANPTGPGSSFKFDEGTIQTLGGNQGIYLNNGTALFGAANALNLESVPTTAGYNTYWNPKRCR